MSIHSGDVAERYISQTNLGRALHLIGEIEDAMRQFEEAKQLRITLDEADLDRSSWYGRFTLQESHYCELLLEEGKTTSAAALLNSVTKTSKEILGLLDYAVYHYSYGKVILNQFYEQYHVDLESAGKHLDEAIENLKKVNRQDELGFAYLARASLNRVRERISLAELDLNTAQEIAQRSNIKIVLADFCLEACRLCLEKSQYADARRNFEDARAIIEGIHYGRRRRTLEELAARIAPE